MQVFHMLACAVPSYTSKPRMRGQTADCPAIRRKPMPRYAVQKVREVGTSNRLWQVASRFALQSRRSKRCGFWSTRQNAKQVPTSRTFCLRAQAAGNRSVALCRRVARDALFCLCVCSAFLRKRVAKARQVETPPTHLLLHAASTYAGEQCSPLRAPAKPLKLSRQPNKRAFARAPLYAPRCLYAGMFAPTCTCEP